MRTWISIFLTITISTVAFSAKAAGGFDVPRCDFPRRAVMARKAFPQTASIRPPASFVLDSSVRPLRVHAQDGVSPDYAAEILATLEDAWGRLFDDMNFVSPHPDGDLGGDARFDVYIVTDLDPGIGGYAGFSGYFEPTSRADAFGYLVLNNELDARLRRFVVAHELFHASQMAYDWWEDLAFMEASATWVTEPVFPDEDIYWRYFPFYQREPWLALDYVSLASPYQYGMGMFVNYLEERHGLGDGELLKRIWEGSVQDDIDNEPDFLDAVKSLLEPSGGLADSVREFGIWRLIVASRDDGAHFREGSTWESAEPFFEVEASPGVTRRDGTLVHPVGPLGHAFLRFPRPPGELADYHLEFAGAEGARLAIDGVAFGGGGFRVFPIAVVEGPEPVTFTAPADPDLEELFLVVSNLGVHYDADSSPWTGAGLAYRFEVHSKRFPYKAR